ncbi:hypothetical protein FVEG_01823 [Fusarium verticillioides 7600]|uniref:Uncharacterized protein n=1 Tax=Gibberella moniliformis (strain M3125 / FGSC 7600) TaxID=334819 RepID=W7LT65_GIBM7|nr:hypothetical protein FVEG_01823 [Fusarium verticillioides 7600]EWG38650.1 hypothetical protein FVEG_01823 [Fusarium verticillioides 7600]
MSSFTPINAKPLEKKQGAPHRHCYLCAVTGSPGEPCKHAERPVVEKGASVGSSGSTNSTSSTSTIINSGKVNNRKICAICNREYNMSNFRDHMKIHYLEAHGVAACVPCQCCKAGQCIVARSPTEIETYACISCLKSHRTCSLNELKTKKGEKCKPGTHPALLHPV